MVRGSQKSEAAAARLKKREALVPIKSHYCRLGTQGSRSLHRYERLGGGMTGGGSMNNSHCGKDTEGWVLAKPLFPPQPSTHTHTHLPTSPGRHAAAGRSASSSAPATKSLSTFVSETLAERDCETKCSHFLFNDVMQQRSPVLESLQECSG